MALSGGRKPGQKWVAWFLQRHSEELEAGKGQGLDPKREKAFCKPVMTDHFKKLGDILRHYEIPLENIYNEDEKGLQLGGGRKNIGTQFIFPHGMKHKILKHSDDLQLISVLEAVSADGTAVPTLMVLPKGSKPGAWWAHENEGNRVTATEAGWSDNSIYLKWFTGVFLPFTLPRNVSGRPRLLRSDSHQSHKTDELKDAAIRSSVILFSLPPHTTDQLQPLDVGVFGPVQIAWVCRSQAATAEGAVITTSMVVFEYLQVHKQAMTKKCIESVFRKTGIHPFNPDLFMDEDFAASLAWVPNSTGPVGYPHIHSSPDGAKLTTSKSDDYMDAPEGETGCRLDSQSNIDESTPLKIGMP
ncbi:hypothetical protein K439DRAFT_1370041 [Ramaria rubella]|nr:hypothetical protein K439DRAFT_1370041 [Ramaria rubella]